MRPILERLTLCCFLFLVGGAALRAPAQPLPSGRAHDARASTVTASSDTDRTAIGDSSVLFVYRGTARRVSVAGDFNGWEPDRDTLTPVPGKGIFVLQKSFDPAARFEYKLVVDGSWMLDPLNRATAVGGFGPNSEIRMPAYLPPDEIVRHPSVPAGTLDTLSITSPILGRAHPVYVYMPPGYRPDASTAPLPVIFVLDGGEYLSLASMSTILDNLIFAKRLPPMSAVFIDPRTDPRTPSTSTRMQDYTLNPSFVAALVQDFRQPLARRYGFTTSAASTGIMGASLGGLAATYAALTRPDVFGLCAAQSPSFQWQRGAIVEMARTLPRADIRFYIDTGTLRDALEPARRMHSVLSGQGYPVRFQTSPEGHNWVNWRARIDDLLEYLFASSPLDRIGITTGHRRREYSFTNKQSAFYYGATASKNSGSWMGLHAGGRRLLDDYAITIDGHPLERAEATTTVYPDRIVRLYPGGIAEEFRLADSLVLCWVTVSTSRAKAVRISPVRRDDRPVPGMSLATVTRILPPGDRVATVFAAGRDAGEAERLGAWALLRLDSLAHARRERMEQVLSRSSVITSNDRFDAAFSWTLLSLDALIMHQGKPGIFAGLPWFTNYWGRDTFISFPGAFLVTGRLREAREVLLSFASFQHLDTTSTDDGRIPNIVNPGDVAYNTADGTPRFVMMAAQYVDRSGDTGFIRTIYPALVRSIEGTLRHHTDSLGFLVHGDAETWMDAVGPQGPWSPRGNRANDVQALWAQQLDAGISFARILGDSVHARSWDVWRSKLETNFVRSFLNDGRIVDHLHPDGTPDRRERPNVLFTRRLAPPEVFVSEVRHVLTRLTYPYGVASLAQTDSNFHPFHEYPPFYPKDAAYHNGTVWTWLQGELISALCQGGRSDLAWTLTENAVHQILDRGATGTQSELLDAVPRPGETEPRLSGTFSQAWNLAEFLRTFYEDFTGIRVSQARKEISVRPALPPSLSVVQATVIAGGIPLKMTIHQGADTTRIVFDTGRTPLRWVVQGSWGGRSIVFPLTGEALTTCVLTRDTQIVHCGSNPVMTTIQRYIPGQWFDGELAFARPAIMPGLRTVQGPSHRLLRHAEVKRNNPHARLLADARDAEGDDTGVDCVTGQSLQYSYPRSANFVPGSFDITRFTARVDSEYLYCSLHFRRLSDPGWHPEYGFQLTYCAVAVDTSPGGSVEIGHHSECKLDSSSAFERLILVGGGVEVEDEKGKVLCGYAPLAEDHSNPLGNAGTGTISFAVPCSLFGKLDARTRFTVLVGAQDDHGGAGIGEFRTVGIEQGEWNGGGRRGGTNVYDRLVAGR